MISPAMLALSERLSASLFADTLHALLLLGLVAAALRLLPSLSAATRSIVWTLVLVLVVGLPWLPAGTGAHSIHLAGGPLEVHLASGWSLVLASLWLLGSLLRGVSLLRSGLRLRAVRRSAIPVRDEAPVASSTAQGAARSAVLCVSESVDRPCVVGFFSPRVLIPVGLYGKLTAFELEQILLHEREHLRRHDDWRNLAQKLALVVFPLHPALIWIDRRLAAERELACDESVLNATRAPRPYATCLVHLAEESGLRRQLSLACGRVGTTFRTGSTRGYDSALSGRHPRGAHPWTRRRRGADLCRDQPGLPACPEPTVPFVYRSG